MIGRKSCILAVGSGLLSAVLSLEAVARAETATSSPQIRPATVVITRQQLDGFAELVGEPSPVVWQRISEDPRIVPLAITAADARARRQRSARALSFFGFVTMGVSLPAALLVAAALSLPGSSGNWNDSSGTTVGATILTVGLLATVGGAAMAIAGNRKGRQKTAAETAACEQYRSLHNVRPPIVSPLLSAKQPHGPGGNIVAIPLLSLRF
jgi:hypothetical protein